MTLGRYPRVTLARARTMALDALARVHVGEDPRRTAAANVADLAAAYLAEYVRPNLRERLGLCRAHSFLSLFDRRSKRKRTVRTTMSRQNRCRRRMRRCGAPVETSWFDVTAEPLFARRGLLRECTLQHDFCFETLKITKNRGDRHYASLPHIADDAILAHDVPVNCELVP